MSRVFTEKFESGTAGASLSAANTSYNSIAGTAAGPTFVSSPSRSGFAAKFILASNTSSLRQDIGVAGTGVALRVYRRYWYIDALTAIVYIGQANLGGTALAKIRLNASGSITIMNGNTAVGTSTLTIATGAWFRVEYKIDVAATTQTCQIFAGANVEGTTPDETISGSYTGGNFDRYNDGPVIATTSAFNLYLDDVADDSTTYPGPEAAVTATIGRPATDITTTGWTGSSAVSPLAQLIGETVRDDATYVQSPANPTSSTFETKLSAVALPSVRSGFTVSYVSWGVSSTTASQSVSLYEGATLRAGPWSDTLTNSPQLFSHVLTDPQCAALAAGTDLRLRFVVTAA